MAVLSYRLTVARLLLASDDHRFVPDAVREVEHTVELMRRDAAVRDEAIPKLALSPRVDAGDLGLERLARTAPPPFDDVLADHLAAFRALAAEIRGAAQAHPTLARCDLGVVTERLDRLTGTARTPTPAAAPRVAELRVDQVAEAAVLRVIARPPPPSLVAFLG
jgi:hypothetical protein